MYTIDKDLIKAGITSDLLVTLIKQHSSDVDRFKKTTKVFFRGAHHIIKDYERYISPK